MPKGFLILLLHAHLPYLRPAARHSWEELLPETIAETYLPLVNLLYDLRNEAIPFRLTLSLSPILAEQLADPQVLDAFETHLLERLEGVAEDEARFERATQQESDPQAAHFLYLARFYHDWYENLLRAFRRRFERDLIAALRLLQEEGRVEIITSAATHAYLPLMERDSTIYAQLRTGVTTYLRHFGRLPRGFWLPECGYRPARTEERAGRPGVRPGLEEFLAELNLRYTVVDGRTWAQMQAGGTHRPIIHPQNAPAPAGRCSPFRPCYIGHSNVAAFGRDLPTGRQVWSAGQGYPGDYVYRDRRRDPRSGLPYWRITGEVPPEEKAPYDPYHAFHRAEEHAAHFVQLVQEYLANAAPPPDGPPVVLVAYDSELLGHWWFEGIPWLKGVLSSLNDQVALVTAGEYLEEYPPTHSVALPESSWGQEGEHRPWWGTETKPLWEAVHRAEREMEQLVARFPDADGERLELLKQAARELLLLQSSDWPYLIGTGQAVEYAWDRFHEHRGRFDQLRALLEKESPDEQDRAFLQECRFRDNPFLNIDYRTFADRVAIASEATPAGAETKR